MNIKLKKITGLLILPILMFLYSCSSGPQLNKYGLKVVENKQYYYEQIRDDSDNTLVNLTKYIPGIVLDIRYATANNFTKQVVYDEPGAFLRKPAAEALKKVQNELMQKGYGLKIFDAYRPYSATVKFWDLVQNSTFVASPKSGSRHNRGCAVDLSIINLKTGNELEMPTGFDNFTEKAGAYYKQVSEKAATNRALLQKLMKENGFDIYEGEWWHFDFSAWKKYDIMDIPFSSLQ